jgi:hypothetical protein
MSRNAVPIHCSLLALRTWICQPITRRSLNGGNVGLRGRVVGIDHQAGDACLRDKIAQQLETLRTELASDHRRPRDIAAGAIEACHQARLDRIVTGQKHDRYRRGCPFGRVPARRRRS